MISYDLSMKDYLSHEALGSSTLKTILQSPADYLAALEQENKTTSAKSLGTTIHTMLLEPHLFDKENAVQPEYWGPKNVGEGKRNGMLLKKSMRENILSAGKIVRPLQESKLPQHAINI